MRAAGSDEDQLANRAKHGMIHRARPLAPGLRMRCSTNVQYDQTETGIGLDGLVPLSVWSD